MNSEVVLGTAAGDGFDHVLAIPIQQVADFVIEISEEWETGKVHLQSEKKQQHPN